MGRVLLPVKRFLQKPGECGIAAMSSLAHFYDSTVDYDNVRKSVQRRNRKSGLWTSQQARILNNLGFSDVTIVTADLTLVDFSWQNLSKRQLINKLTSLQKYYRRCRKIDKDWHKSVADMVDWLRTPDCDNKLIVDDGFASHIRRHLDKGRPVGAAVTVTSMFQLQKRSKGGCDDIRGDSEDHAIVIRGYDDKGVYVVDSDYGFARNYKRLKKYERGYYKIPWEKFLVNIPAGDLILVN